MRTLIIATFIVGGAAVILCIALALCQFWERVDTAYTLREAYREGRKKLILGS